MFISNPKVLVHRAKTANTFSLAKYFPETDGINNWIPYPFHALPPVHLPMSEQESLIEIATSSSVKTEFNQKPLPDFWIGLRSEFCLGKSRC